MAIQTGSEPITITHLGQYALRNAEGAYTLMVVRAEDGAVLASVDLDTSKGNVDAMGFKYAALSTPLRLDPAPAQARCGQAPRTEAGGDHTTFVRKVGLQGDEVGERPDGGWH